MQVKKVAIDSIGPDPMNARLHGERNLDAIRHSLLTYGQVEPVVVNVRTGLIVGGHGRVAVMRDLGWTDVEIVELDLEPASAMALGLALNRSAELAEWNEEALAALIASVREIDPSLLEVTGFTPLEVQDLLQEKPIPGGNQPIDEGKLSLTSHECPSCGFKW